MSVQEIQAENRMGTCDGESVLPAVFPWERPCERSSESRHHPQTPQQTTERSLRESTHSARCTAACPPPETSGHVTGDPKTFFTCVKESPDRFLTHVGVLVSILQTQNALPVVADPWWRRELRAVFSIWGQSIIQLSQRMCRNTTHVGNCSYIFRPPYQEGEGVVGAEMGEEEERMWENPVHRGSWAGELGWSFSWGGSAQHGKAPVSPATGRSCDPGMEAAQHSGGVHCWNKGTQRRALLINITLALIMTGGKRLWLFNCLCPASNSTNSERVNDFSEARGNKNRLRAGLVK